MPYYKNIHTLFIHIPKTGGSSLEAYLRRKSPETLFNRGGNPKLPTNDLQKYSLQHQTYLTIYQQQRVLGVPFNDTLKVITIVRNPYHRTISDLFWYKLMNKTVTDKARIFDIMKHYIHKDIYDNHNTPQYKYITNENGELYKHITIFRTETLTKDLQQYGFTDYNGQEKGNEYFHLLNKDSIRLINQVYQKDFELFGYTMIDPDTWVG
jgi:hypothetical protein